MYSLLKRSYLLLIVLALSLLFRITNLDLIEFKADEGINLFLASRPIFGHGFAPGGTVSSLGVTNFPLINYLLLPLVMISKDPRIISFFIANGYKSLFIDILGVPAKAPYIPFEFFLRFDFKSILETFSEMDFVG